MTITQMLPDERPREKMEAFGPERLTKAELLAVLIGSGSKSSNALDLAHSLLKEASGKLSNLSAMSLDRMTFVRGIGKAKAASILAAFELGRRFALESFSGNVEISRAEQIYSYMIPRLRGLDHEQCWVIYLTNSNNVIASEMISMGNGNITPFQPTDIGRKAIDKKSSKLVLVHNHPSGSSSPSTGDIEMTKQLKNVLNQLEIKLIDHVIICDTEFFSFVEEMVHRIGE